MTITLAQAGAALANGEFVPFFQPVVEMRSGKLICFEVLARWMDPIRGLIPPDEFIPAAEEDGWISKLTLQLLHQAFAVPEFAASGVELAFNLSALQFHDHNLPTQIFDIATKAAFPMDRVCLELTESAIVGDVANNIAYELKEMGCQLALDDFGTGYSGLRHLQGLPFDILKVDRSFVGSMTTNKESRKIVAAIVGLGQSLGIATVAEGIETEEQDEMLLWLGCDSGQGWLYGKAVPATEIPGVLALPRARKTPQRAASEVSHRHSVSAFDLAPAMRLAQLQAVYDGAPVGLAFVDREMRFVTLNKRLAVINGFPMKAHLGRTVEEIIPDRYSVVEPQLRRALNGESIPLFEVEEPMSSPNRGKWFLVSYEPARDEACEVVGVSVAIADITAIRLAEEARREAEDHFRHLLDLNPQIPWILDAEGRALDVSYQWEAATGSELGSWKGLGWLDAIHPDDLELTKKVLYASLESGNPMDVSYRVRPANGEWTWKRARGWPRYDSSGKIVYWYGILQDCETEAFVLPDGPAAPPVA